MTYSATLDRVELGSTGVPGRLALAAGVGLEPAANLNLNNLLVSCIGTEVLGTTTREPTTLALVSMDTRVWCSPVSELLHLYSRALAQRPAHYRHCPISRPLQISHFGDDEL